LGQQLINLNVVLHLDGDLLGNCFDQVLHSFLLLEVSRDDPDESESIHKLGDGFFQTDNAFLIKGLELPDKSRQELDVILCLCVFSDQLLHGRLKFLERRLDGAVVILIAVFLVVFHKSLFDDLDLFLGELLVDRAQASMFLFPAIDFSPRRGFLFDLLIEFVLRKGFGYTGGPRFLF
jgi:hypothetical protein